jgi:hypothetical protein
MKQILSLIPAFTLALSAQAQCLNPDLGALEGIIFEVYYISDTNDATDTDGGQLPVGSVTWRIYADMKPQYSLLSAFGNANNTLSLSTTTSFFNNEDRGEILGSSLPANRLNDNTVALDSYLTMGPASTVHWGVPKSDDPDGSIIGGANNDGGSAGVPEGLLNNSNPLMGQPLTVADGLVVSPVTGVTVVPNPGVFGMFDNTNSNAALTLNDGAWAVLGGSISPLPENRVLIAQLTSDGIISGCLNLQVGIPIELQGAQANCKTNIRYFANLTQVDINTAAANTTTDRWAAATIDGLCFTLDPATVDVNDWKEQNAFAIYPNPASSFTTVAARRAGTNLTYELIDGLGRVILAQNAGKVFAPVEVNLDRVKPGIFFLRLCGDGHCVTKKLIKQ